MHVTSLLLFPSCFIHFHFFYSCSIWPPSPLWFLLTTGRWTSQNALSWLSRIFLSALSFFLSILPTEETDHSYTEPRPLKYPIKQHKLNKSCLRVKAHKHTHTHRLRNLWQSRLDSKRLRSMGPNLSAHFTQPCLASCRCPYVTDILPIDPCLALFTPQM